MEKSDRVFMMMSILVVLAYAWLTAWALEPRWEPPPTVASAVVWVESGHPHSSSEIAKHDSELVMRVHAELQAVETAVALIGPFRARPVVFIHLQGGSRYVVDGERVDLSDRIARAPGQLTKAMLKAWWYQRPASGWTPASLLRFEVITDVLTALARNEPVMGEPGSPRPEEFPELAPWLDFASSYESSRETSWPTLELKGFTGRSPRMNPLAFRPLLDSILWRAFQRTSPLERLALTRAWIRDLHDRNPGWEVAFRSPPQSLREWRDWLREEVRAIAGSKLSIESELRAAGLGENDTLQIGTAIFTPETDTDVSEKTPLVKAARESWALKQKDGEFWLVTHQRTSGRHAWLRISEQDWRQLRPARFLWAGCHPPVVSEMLAESLQAEKIIFAAICQMQTTESAVQALVRGGLKELASLDSDVEFLQLRRSALEIAVRQRWLRPERRVTEILDRKLGGGLFGAENAQWNPGMNAFRLIGAIEAVEWVGGKRIRESGSPVPGAPTRL